MTNKLALGIDIGGTNTKLALVTPAGELGEVHRMPTAAHGSDPAPFFARLYDLIDPVLAEADVIGIGVSTHGAIADDRSGPVACNNTPALRGVNMRGLLAERYDLPVILNNDLTAHTLGEYHFGTGQGSRHFMAMAIGTGLGAGIIINGEPLRFVYGNAGDTGRLILEPDGPPDVYGVRGSAEALCGVPGIERLARENYGWNTDARTVISAARVGSDERATAIMAQIGMYLGTTLANLALLFYPDRIALTGGTAAAGEVLRAACQRQFDALLGDYYYTVTGLMDESFRQAEIVLGGGGETGILGAVVELF